MNWCARALPCVGANCCTTPEGAPAPQQYPMGCWPSHACCRRATSGLFSGPVALHCCEMQSISNDSSYHLQLFAHRHCRPQDPSQPTAGTPRVPCCPCSQPSSVHSFTRILPWRTTLHTSRAANTPSRARASRPSAWQPPLPSWHWACRYRHRPPPAAPCRR